MGKEKIKINRKKQRQNISTLILIICLIIIMVASGSILLKYYKEAKSIDDEDEKIQQIINEDATDNNKSSVDWQNAVLRLKNENKDFIGYLQWDSDIVSQPVVQGETNDTYLRHSFYGKYNSAGCPFLDSSMTIDGTNFVIYGHNVYYDSSSMFTPLLGLREQEGYEKNKTFWFYTPEGAKHFEVIGVCEINQAEYNTADYQDHYSFQRNKFSGKEDWEKWMSYFANHSMIKPTSKAEYGDQTMCLQVCKPYHHDTKVIIIAKKIQEYAWGKE